MQKDDAFDALTTLFAVRFGADEIRPVDLIARLRTGQPTLLIDVRESAEQGVSQIDGAVLTSPRTDFAVLDIVRDFCETNESNSDALIVFYCAGGYRSAKAVSEFSGTARSLHGGIVGWVRAGGSVVDAQGQSTMRVHTYNSAWAGYVDPPYLPVTEPPVA